MPRLETNIEKLGTNYIYHWLETEANLILKLNFDRNEHEDFKEEMERLRALRGKAKKDKRKKKDDWTNFTQTSIHIQMFIVFASTQSNR